MSRAFTKEGDGGLDPLPDLPVSRHPNYVTCRGLGQLQSRLRQAQTALAVLRARPDRLDKLPEAAAERDIRYLEQRLRSAMVIDPASLPLTTAAFGLRITVADPAGGIRAYQIVGEDEACAAEFRIASQSPLARALMGARRGDSVTWHRPTGDVVLTIDGINHADPCA